DPRGAQIVHHLHHLGLFLAEPDHEAGLGEHRRIDVLDAIQEAQRMEIARARPYLAVEPRHGFEIVVEHVGPRRDDDLERAVLLEKIGRQHFDGGIRRVLADRFDGAGELRGAAVGQIVAIDRGNDDVVEAELRHRLADARRLMRIEQIGPPGRDIAEGAGAGADAAEDHYRGMTFLPALADIRAGRFLAYGVELERAHQVARLAVFRRIRRLDADPWRLRRRRIVGPMRLLGMTKGGRVAHATRCGARRCKRQAPTRASFPTGWDAETRCASIPARSSPGFWRWRNPGSAR